MMILIFRIKLYPVFRIFRICDILLTTCIHVISLWSFYVSILLILNFIYIDIWLVWFLLRIPVTVLVSPGDPIFFSTSYILSKVIRAQLYRVVMWFIFVEKSNALIRMNGWFDISNDVCFCICTFQIETSLFSCALPPYLSCF